MAGIPCSAPGCQFNTDSQVPPETDLATKLMLLQIHRETVHPAPVTSTATMAESEEWVWVMTCPTTGCDTGKGAPFKTVNVSEATATALLEQHIASAHTTTTVTSDVTRRARPASPSHTPSVEEWFTRIKSLAEATIKHEPSKSANKVDKPGTRNVARQANMANMVTPELGRTLPSCTTLTDSVQLPAVPSTTAEDPYGLLLTKSLPEEIGIKSSAEAATKPATSDVTRRANRAAKKAKQRDAKYGPEKLLLAQTKLEKQVNFKKDTTDSMQLLTKSPQDGPKIKSSIPEATPQSSRAEASLQSSTAEATIKTSMAEASLQSSTAEAAFKTSISEASPQSPISEAAPQSSAAETALKTSEEAATKISEEIALKTSEEAAIKISEETTLKTSEEAAIKASEEEAFKISEETALKTSEEAALKTSEEATTKTETMCSSEKLAVNESLCISSQVCKTFDDDPSQTEVTMANTDVTSSQPEITMANTDVTSSQTEITKDNTDENPSQPEIAKVDKSVTSNVTKQAKEQQFSKANKYTEQQSSDNPSTSTSTEKYSHPVHPSTHTGTSFKTNTVVTRSQAEITQDTKYTELQFSEATKYTEQQSYETHSLRASTEKYNWPVSPTKSEKHSKPVSSTKFDKAPSPMASLDDGQPEQNLGREDLLYQQSCSSQPKTRQSSAKIEVS